MGQTNLLTPSAGQILGVLNAHYQWPPMFSQSRYSNDPLKFKFEVKMRGRKPKPTPLKLLSNNAGRRPSNMNEPEPEAPKDLTPPAWLDELGLEFWNSLAPQLHMMGLLSEIDLPLFTSACERWSTYRRAIAELQKQLTRNSKANGRVAKPEAAIAKAALDSLRAILAEFGIGPASRSRVVAKPLWGKDPVEEYKKRKFNARKFLA